ncbi:MAG: transglutaminase-like domain-containing protein [Archangium sp.]|nr:transglutaminase-like domain-containing protein [Archangium sp.]
MRRDSKLFRGGSGLLAVLAAHFLCGGTQWAAAADAESQADARRVALAATLKLPVEALANPAEYQRAQAVAAAARQAAGLEQLTQHTASPKQAIQRVRSANLARGIEGKEKAARLSVAASKAKALALSPEAARNSLELAAPGFKLAVSRAPKGPPTKTKAPQAKPKPVRPEEPRTKWPKQGALSPTLEQLYASAGDGARVVLSDGSEVEASQMALTPVRAPTRLASLMSDYGLMLPLLGVLPPPAPEDTAQTPETTRTPAVAAQLQQTGSSALAIYNFALTKIRPELYFGSKKGADATLREGAGNDFDTASLLIALLRGAGIPARYEYGTVALSQAQAESLTGAKTAQAAAQLLGSVGVPNALSPDGTQLVIERVWVRAFVTAEGRYGAAGGPSHWVRLDAGLKQQRWAPVANLKGAATFSQADYLAAPQTKSPQAMYEAQLLATARAANLCNTLDEALYLGTLTQAPLNLLPVEHPGTVLASLLTFARPPASMRWTVSVDGGGLSASFELAQLGYHSLALRYVGATPADVSALLAAGDITNVVPFQVQVVPVLRLDGVEVARGTPALVGTSQALAVRTTVPQGSPRSFTHRLVAGGVYALSLSGGVTTDEWVATQRRGMTGLPSGSPEAAEATAHAVQALYSHRGQTSARRLAALTGHVVVMDAFESLAGRQLLVTESNGVPVSVRWGLYFIDATDSLTPLARDGNAAQVENLSELFGMHGSYLESQAWEEVFSRKALSTVTIIHAARAQGIPVDCSEARCSAGPA